MSRNKEQNFFNENSVSRMVTDWINSSEKTQAELTAEMGFQRTNILTMFKQGRSPFPIKYVIPLAKATGNDPEKLMKACLKQYMPEVLECMAMISKGVVDSNEESLLKTWRKFRKSQDSDPEFTPTRANKLKRTFEEIFSITA